MAPDEAWLSSIALSLSIIFSTLSIGAIGSPHFVYSNCTTANNFTDNSFYKTNLNQVLPGLTAQAASNSFYNLSAGSDPNTVYALYNCRGDIAPQSNCNDCVKAAAGRIVSDCPVEKEAIIYYEECMLRYSNRSIFAFDDENGPGGILNSNNNVSNPTQFLNALAKIFDQLAEQAAFNSSSKRYAEGSINVTDSQTIYCLVQCTPDLNSTQCDSCLQAARWLIKEYCYPGSIHASVYLPSCIAMYDITQFKSGDHPLAPPPPPPSPKPSPPPSSDTDRGKRGNVIAISVSVAAGAAVVLLLGILLFRSHHRKDMRIIESRYAKEGGAEYRVEGATQFDLRAMKAATENFSPANKLGEGGFGSVYKGKLQNGQEVAIKRLSKEAIHGVKQFINEVQLIVKLQHRNLVRLVGFCAEGEERLVVYEFMPKLSLDYYLFDRSKSKYISWETRYKIIEGIARGLHYLHEDSRHMVVHRDLKASNILLDEDMNPKIADFGIAKLVMLDQTQGNNTTKIVGTRGYMAPEYAMAGHYSIKSDVYSFGVLLLEIVSSQSSSQQYQLEPSEGLLAYAWKQWTQGDIEELIDPTLRNTVSRMEVGRCIQIGLLCAQYDAASRPTTHALLLMLNSRSMELSSPSPPSPFYQSTDIPYSSYQRQQTGSEFSTGAWNLEKDLYPR